MSKHVEVPMPVVSRSGFEAGLSEDEQAVQETMHRFAHDVLRPLGRVIDQVPAKEAYQPGSPFCEYHAEME